MSLVCLRSSGGSWEGEANRQQRVMTCRRMGPSPQDPGADQAEKYREAVTLERVTRPDHVSVSSPIFPAFVLCIIFLLLL